MVGSSLSLGFCAIMRMCMDILTMAHSHIPLYIALAKIRYSQIGNPGKKSSPGGFCHIFKNVAFANFSWLTSL